MSSEDTVNRIAEQLDKATTFQMVFGAIPTGKGVTKYAQRQALKASYRALSLMVHPDKLATLSSSVQKKGTLVFEKLTEAYDRAERAIDAGTYGKAIGAESLNEIAAIELQSSKSTYTLEEKAFAYGDFSVLYRGRSSDGKNVIAKISSTPPHNIWLEQEAKTIERFHTKPELMEVGKYIPTILDGFYVTNGSKRYRVNVWEDKPHLLSIKDLIDAFYEGMDPRDAAWICRRILGQVATASMAGLVHGAIVPDHVMVDIESHDPISIGWSHAIPKGDTLTHIIDRWRAYYPPEVFARQPVDTRSDIFMAGKTMIALLGGDPTTNKMPKVVPASMAAVVKRCVDADPAKRFQTGKEALDEMTRVVKAEWGRTFRKLVIPEPLPQNNFAQVVDRELEL